MSTVHINENQEVTLSAEEIVSIGRLSSTPIDYSDIPESNPEDWKHAVRGKFYRPVKQGLFIRLDADVIAWQKAKGKGYQSRINAILRAAMFSEIKGFDTVS